jgi:ribosomal protein L29
MVEKKQESAVKEVKKTKANDNEKKLKSLKIELLKQPQKAKNIKKEIARMLTSTKSGDKK